MRVHPVGRLESVPRRTWERALARQGGKVVRTVGSADLVVIGTGAASRPVEKLRADIAALREKNKPLLSERAFLRRVGLLPPLADEARPFSAKELATRSRVDEAEFSLCVLFDIVEGDGQFGFRALKAGIQAGELLKTVPLRDLVQACRQIRERLHLPEPLSALTLAPDREGHLMLRTEGAFAELDGQLRLELPGSAVNASDLLADAEEAREAGLTKEALQALRRAYAAAPKDVDVLFELGSLLCELGEHGEGSKLLRRATTLRPDFADAWYNLGHAAEVAGRPEDARKAYDRAAGSDAAWADPHYNLGMLALDDERYEDAITYLERYLALDTSSEWAKKAKRALSLARMSRVKSVGA